MQKGSNSGQITVVYSRRGGKYRNNLVSRKRSVCENARKIRRILAVVVSTPMEIGHMEIELVDYRNTQICNEIESSKCRTIN